MTTFDEVARELARAREKFPPFHSAHEGYAVLLEEVEELKREVFWGPTKMPAVHPLELTREHQRIALMRAEAIQVAAMAVRFIEDVCDAPAPGTPDPSTNPMPDCTGGQP